MPTSAIPQVIDALLAKATAALPDVNVFDGLAVTSDPGDFLMVGVDDPDTEGSTFSADSDQAFAHMGPAALTDEEGDITCVALSWNGDGDAKLARDTVDSIGSNLAAAIKADVTLGVPCLLWARFGSSVQFSQAQGSGGASAFYIFRIHFRARF